MSRKSLVHTKLHPYTFWTGIIRPDWYTQTTCQTRLLIPNAFLRRHISVSDLKLCSKEVCVVRISRMCPHFWRESAAPLAADVTSAPRTIRQVWGLVGKSPLTHSPAVSSLRPLCNLCSWVTNTRGLVFYRPPRNFLFYLCLFLSFLGVSVECFHKTEVSCFSCWLLSVRKCPNGVNDLIQNHRICI